MSHRKLGKTIGVTTSQMPRDVFSRFFIWNERQYENGGRPWTDAEIAEWMTQEFPHANPKTPERVKRARSSYNNGRKSWADVGPAGTADRPLSYEYDKDGKRVERKRGGPRGAGVSEAQMRKLIREELSQQTRPTITIEHVDQPNVEIDGGKAHEKLDKVLRKVRAGLHVFLVGPTGSGKTYLAAQIAEALGKRFTFNSISEGVQEKDILGRTLPDSDGNWTYRPSPFIETWQNGGVHLFDEADAADPNVLIQINAALANGKVSVPFRDETEPIEKNDECVVLLAANTFGTGANAEYVGRNQLDAATLNRFSFSRIFVGYDESLERSIVEGILGAGEMAETLLNWGWSLRGRIEDARIRRVFSTRNFEQAARCIHAGETFDDIKGDFFIDWSEDEIERVGVSR